MVYIAGEELRVSALGSQPSHGHVQKSSKQTALQSNNSTNGIIRATTTSIFMTGLRTHVKC